MEPYAVFPYDLRQDGGAIYQTKIGTMTFNAMATFFRNRADEVRMILTFDCTGVGVL